LRSRRGEDPKPPRVRAGRSPTGPASPKFPNRIRELRQAAALTQEELGNRARLSKQEISALERGAKQVMPATGQRIAAALGRSLAEILGEVSARSVPITLVIAGSFSESRPTSFDRDPPWTRVEVGPRLAEPEACLGAEIADDSADLDYPAGTVLVIRPFAPGESVALGRKIAVRFWLDPQSPLALRRTREILYGLLDKSLAGDLLLLTRSTNPEIPRTLLIEPAQRPSALHEAPALSGLLREQRARAESITFDPDPAAPATILGGIVWQSGPA
jgi:transcriptional regulator with XRE-family HTH domain